MANIQTARRYACIGLAGLASVAISASMASALYGPRVTIGDVYQQTSSTTSRDGTVDAPCDAAHSGGACRFIFQAVPNLQKLTIEHVSCVIFSDVDARSAILMSRKNEAAPFRFSALTPIRTSTISTVVSGTVLHPLTSAERAIVEIDYGSTVPVGGFCTISGRLVPEP